MTKQNYALAVAQSVRDAVIDAWTSADHEMTQLRLMLNIPRLNLMLHG